MEDTPLSSISSISSNLIDMEAMGNVCVAIRFRPPSIYNDEAEADIAFNETAGMIGVTPPKMRRREMFAFSSVHVRESNEAIFEAYGMPLCNSVLGGYNGALLAYGQTGSGKTFTMGETARIGSLEEGMSHRMVRQLFSAIAADSGHSYEISMLYVQVYCERIYDLLIEKQPEVVSNPKFAVPSTSSPAQPRSPRPPPAPARREPDSFGSPSKREDTSLSVREDKKNGVFVQGATTNKVSSAEEALALMERASAQLVFAWTKLNQHSSRSHSLCTLLVKRTERAQRGTAGDQEGGPPKSDVHAKLVLVDLAGSEDVGRSGVTGQCLAEAQKINQSLLALGNVIHALTRTEGGKKIGSATTHVPFRSSVLTRLLSDSIGGNCRTTLICCCSPASADVSETLSTLRFGCRAKLVRFDSTLNAALPANMLLSNLLPSQTGYIKYMRQVKTDTITQAELNKLRDLPWNSTCFDCTALEPAWVALPHGVFICVDCAQTHRNMGQHVSQTKAINTSTHLWSPAELAVVHEVGNAVAAVAYADFALPPKPSWAATPAAKMAYSQEKYGRGSPDFKAAAEQLHAQPALWTHLARAAEAQIAEAKVKAIAEDEAWAAQAQAKPKPTMAVATQAAGAATAATAEAGSCEEQEALACEMALAAKSEAEQEAAGELGEVSDEARDATASRATILQQQQQLTPTQQPQPPQPSQVPPWQKQQTHQDGAREEAVRVTFAAAELRAVSASALVVEAQQVAEEPVTVKAAEAAETAKAEAVEAAKAEVAKAAAEVEAIKTAETKAATAAETAKAEAVEAAKAEVAKAAEAEAANAADAEEAKKKMYEDDDDEFDLWDAPLSAAPALKKTASFSKAAAAEKAAAEDALVASIKARAVAQKTEAKNAEAEIAAAYAAAKAAEAQAAKMIEVEAVEVAPLSIHPPALTTAAAEHKEYEAIIPNKAPDQSIVRRLEPQEEVALYAVMQQAVAEAEEEAEEQVEAEAEDEALEMEAKEEASGSANASPLGDSASGCPSAAASGYASEASSPPSSSTFISTHSRPDVFLSLEAGLEELAKVCTKAGTKRDSISVLAEHLKRNNPRHSPAAAQKLADMRAEAARLAAAKAAMASGSAGGGREKRSEKPPRPVRPQHVATGIGYPDVDFAFTTQTMSDDSAAAPRTKPQPSEDELLDEMPSASTLLMPQQDDDQHSLSEFLTTTWKLNILESLRRESTAEPSAGSDGGDAGNDASVATLETTPHGGLQSPRSPRSPKTAPRMSPAAAEPDASAAVAEPGTAERLLQPSASGREKPPRPGRLSAPTDASVAFTSHSLGAGNRSPPPRAGRLYAATGFGEPDAGTITPRSTPGATSSAESAVVFETPLCHGRPYMGEAATGFGAALGAADAASKRSTPPGHVDPLKALLENTGQFFKKSGDEIGKAFSPDSPGRRKPRESCLY